MGTHRPSTGAGTVLLPRVAARSTGRRTRTLGLATDLLSHSASRLRTLALLYAFVFFMAGFFPALLFERDRAQLFSSPRQWLPGVMAIVIAVIVAAVIRNPRVSLSTAMTIGLLWEVASSYGIAAAEFLDPATLAHISWLGLSWVAVWTVLFTVVVPTQPRRALVAALASVSSVPAVIAYANFSNIQAMGLLMFFFYFVFPYLLVVTMAYVGARVVYTLGTEVTAARELGSYRLVERLGQGGMGEVWRAKHQLLARPAAIKLIRPSAIGADPAALDEARLRFEREAQAIARLRSPHTVNLFDFGVASDGAFYYVMELLDGFDLDSLVRQHGPLPASRAVHLLRQVCHSLSEAESCGLVHRDIKPANIFVCRYGEDDDFVKVLDFGIVKPVHDTSDTATLTNERNVLRGTPAFIAPEQVLGNLPLDGRVDIYSTGCVAYWLLTGEYVFVGSTTMALLVQHANAAPNAPSTRTELPVPPALDRLVLSCLAKNPADRPQSARELSSRLDEAVGKHLWTRDDARSWWTQHRPVVPEARRA